MKAFRASSALLTCQRCCPPTNTLLCRPRTTLRPLPTPLRLPSRRCFSKTPTRRAAEPPATATVASSQPRRNNRVVVVLAVTAAVGATVVLYQDQIQHGYRAAQRSGRVAAALFMCITDYRKTLKHNATLDDEEEKARLLSACHQRCANRTLSVLEKNGSIFIKLGQHLSAMNYLLPPEWTTTFIPLQDRCPVSSFESIEQMYLDDTGESLWAYFSDFDSQPIGAASLAQVHLATVRETGQKVAVKVQHPALKEWAGLDLALTSFTFAMVKKYFPSYDLEWLSSEMEESLPHELDFNREADNARRTKEYFSHLPQLPLVIPEVLWAKKRILVMESVSGRRLDDLDFLDSNGIDRDQVSAALAHIFNEMIFGDNAPLHCDPHGGNLAIRKNETRSGCNFDIILYDHGLYRDIPVDLRRSYAKMWLAVIDADEPRMRKYAKEVAGISDEQFPLFASAITGREWRVVQKSSIASERQEAERDNMSGRLADGMLQELVQMLGQVPRIILLILKTNDLTRSLDESLHTRMGQVHTFLILARYCARTVFQEQMEGLRARGSLLWPGNAARLVTAWFDFYRVEMKLEVYELWLQFKRLVGVQVDLV